MEAQPGASSTGVAWLARSAAAPTTRSMTSVSPPVDLDDADIGRVSRKRVGDHRAVPAEQHDAAQPVLAARTRSSNRAPLASPPATHTTGS